MTKLRITIPSENFETSATLLEADAPKTCKAISDILPVEGQTAHPMLSGNYLGFMFPTQKMMKLEPENWVYGVIPGDLLYYYSHWGDAKYIKVDNPEYDEIMIPYGRYVRLRDLSFQPAPGNWFGSLDDKVKEFAEIAKRTRVEGTKKMRLERI